MAVACWYNCVLTSMAPDNCQLLPSCWLLGMTVIIFSHDIVGEGFWPEKGLSVEHRDHQDLACLLATRSFIKVHTFFFTG